MAAVPPLATPAAAPLERAAHPRPPWLLIAALALALLSALTAGLLWQRLSIIQEQLARQVSDHAAQAAQALTLAKQAQQQTQDTAARLSLTELKVAEVSLQRSQLEELMQSLSRSRDENLVVDIESALRLAQQQAQLTGSVQPLLAALKTAEQRIQRSAQPRLAPLQRAIAKDVDRLKTASVSDTPTLLLRLDELVRQVDELPLANALPSKVGKTPAGSSGEPAVGVLPSWMNGLAVLREEVRALVRVSRIDQPEAALLAPEQAFFLRENLKLKLLNARLGVLARQTDSSRADLSAAAAALGKYFDPQSRKTQASLLALAQVQAELKVTELPRLDATFAALTTAAAGR
ncbi:MAG: uroporphyrinogen-III C-methyltransferase [Burkholderiaceae bacterium]